MIDVLYLSVYLFSFIVIYLSCLFYLCLYLLAWIYHGIQLKLCRIYALNTCWYMDPNELNVDFFHWQTRQILSKKVPKKPVAST